ncbi:SGNH/GDSL hydrolase family protein [Robiginitalea sp. SC105]|uniref:SGNH/GDSL hydrolase family protein n=1 Tax=Robiginitalea sp. SC105 TaxID=2762332 RepID=UPI00163A1EAC|nr:SGNH/GDSL hydrolase family protein [Robiginitalea sp. SC105]MBC2839970.1 G-D-S-L family lipolytic protein [Robiginitalea sp. SC105]
MINHARLFRISRPACLLAIIPLLFCTSLLRAQDPDRFKEEIAGLTARNDSLWNPYRPTYLFTGSSSIRMWESLSADFPDRQVINTGFGGSQASDLLFFLDPLVMDYNPLMVLIYEGDNDLAEGKSPGRAIRDIREILRRIRSGYPGMPVVLISAKPSISRWRLRGKYARFNRKLQRLAAADPLTRYANVWTPMLRPDGSLDETLFIEDGLHMNPAGYRIWQSVLDPLLKNTLK